MKIPPNEAYFNRSGLGAGSEIIFYPLTGGRRHSPSRPTGTSITVVSKSKGRTRQVSLWPSNSGWNSRFFLGFVLPHRTHISKKGTESAPFPETPPPVSYDLAVFQAKRHAGPANGHDLGKEGCPD